MRAPNRAVDRHAHVKSLATMRSLALTLRIPFVLLNRFSKLPDFPPPYRMGKTSLEELSSAHYLYCREDVLLFLGEHLDELPDNLEIRYEIGCSNDINRQKWADYGQAIEAKRRERRA